VDDLLAVIHHSSKGLDAVEAVATRGEEVPEIGED
jgi:hypothetical protein